MSLSVPLQMAANDSFSLAYLGNPQPGDLIEIFRPAYQHWALYLGDGYIINVAPVGKSCPTLIHWGEERSRPARAAAHMQGECRGSRIKGAEGARSGSPGLVCPSERAVSWE